MAPTVCSGLATALSVAERLGRRLHLFKSASAWRGGCRAAPFAPALAGAAS